MKIKTNWTNYIHNLREKEFRLISNKFPNKRLFNEGLEIGAGDGFLSLLLSQYVQHLICTDYNPDRLKIRSKKSIEVKICDAEIIEKYFKRGQFDLILSSNLLEHLPCIQSALNGIHEILKDDGITIHVMPNSLWKIIQIFLFYPDRIITLVEKITEKSLKKNLNSICATFHNNRIGKQEFQLLGNNPKVKRKTYSYPRNLLWPIPHGAYKSNIEEFFKYTKRRWLDEFKRANFNVIKVIPGPFSSGYGLGFEKLRKKMEQANICSEYIYIAEKEGVRSKYSYFF